MNFHLQGKISLLRPVNLRDVQSLAELASNIKIWQNLSDDFPHPYTPLHSLEFITAALKVFPPVNFAIEYEGRAVGVISIELKKGMYRKKAEIGYWLGEPFWNKGIVSEAIVLLTAYAFKNFDLVKLEAKTFSFNKASEKVLLKAGFIKLNTIPEDAVKDNKMIDLNYFYLLKSDFLKSKLLISK
jgi:RimJ/RimL family protein N-acetyltransferase